MKVKGEGENLVGPVIPSVARNLALKTLQDTSCDSWLKAMSQKNRNKPQMRVLLEVLAAATLACLVRTNSALSEAAQDVSGAPAQASKPARLHQNPGGFVLRSQGNLGLDDCRGCENVRNPRDDLD